MKTPKRVAIIHAFFVLFAIALIGRAAKVQVVEGKDWVSRAKRQHFFAGVPEFAAVLGDDLLSGFLHITRAAVIAEAGP